MIPAGCRPFRAVFTYDKTRITDLIDIGRKQIAVVTAVTFYNAEYVRIIRSRTPEFRISRRTQFTAFPLMAGDWAEVMPGDLQRSDIRVDVAGYITPTDDSTTFARKDSR